MPKKSLYLRYIKPLLLEALKDSPVVLIHGPRQCGKTTLARTAAEPLKYKYINFDDHNAAESAKADPMGFVNSLPKRVILDEIQKAPQLFSAFKRAIDNRRTPGWFILTGSTNILRLPKLSDSMAGRMHILRLHPLSQEEITGGPSCFLDSLFKGQFKTAPAKKSFKPFIESIIMGGYPEALSRPQKKRKTAWYKHYIDILLQRDILDLAQIRSADVIPKLLVLSAARTSGLVNFAALSSALQTSRPMMNSYITLLEQMFFLEKLQPWYHNRLKRFIKTPKLHLCDTGLACTLLNETAVSLRKNPRLLGQLLETFVFQELKRQASYHHKPHSFFYYRDKKGYEVDIVIERGRWVAGVEVKSSTAVNLSDFKGLRKLKTLAGRQFACGVIVYNGDLSLRFGPKLFAVPLARLGAQTRLGAAPASNKPPAGAIRARGRG